MPIGHDGRTGVRRAAHAPAGARRRRSRAGARRARLLALLLLILPSALVLAAPVQASMTPAELEARHATNLAERAARRATRLAEHEARHEAKQAAIRAKREAMLRARKEHSEIRHPNGSVVFTCNQITWNYKGFADVPGNTVAQQLTIDHDHSTRLHSTFTFDGPTGTAITPLDGHAGRYQVDAWAVFTIEGVKRHFDLYQKVTCPPAPALSIAKLQRIGPAGAYSPSTLIGEVGQTVEYEIVIKNTGNIAVTLGALEDPRCDPGTIAGGPGGAELAIGATTTFTCTHVLSAADQTAGTYVNVAGDTATPVGEGSPVTGESNPVVVEVPAGEVQPEKTPEQTPEKLPDNKGNSETPSSGVLALSTATPAAATGLNGSGPKTGVLASKAAIPALNGPHGCVRAAFKASIKSAGVKGVGFYMDKHKLKTMTAHSARHGRLTITIDPSTLSVGAHRLLARITMVPTSPGAKARQATRSMNVVRCSSAVLTPHFTG